MAYERVKPTYRKRNKFFAFSYRYTLNTTVRWLRDKHKRKCRPSEAEEIVNDLNTTKTTTNIATVIKSQ